MPGSRQTQQKTLDLSCHAAGRIEKSGNFSYECLSILSGKSIDRVYCDYHEDFVTRTQRADGPIYDFYQVKTKEKKNYQWSKLEVFGLTKRKAQSPARIAESFAGKLLLHTVHFKNSCRSIVFLTNVQFHDEVENVFACLLKNDFSHQDVKMLVEQFNAAFAADPPLQDADVQARLCKLSLRPGVSYLDPHDTDFYAFAREAIYNYSEVDLRRTECQEIARSLLRLVEIKSFSKLLEDIEAAELDDAAGIGIEELLDILSISHGAFNQLRKGGDPHPVRNASIIQRTLSYAGATAEMIEFCSQVKIQWDAWFRDKRHTLLEFDLNFLLQQLSEINVLLTTRGIPLQELHGKIDELWKDVAAKGISTTLSKELLLGGVFSAMVRSQS